MLSRAPKRRNERRFVTSDRAISALVFIGLLTLYIAVSRQVCVAYDAQAMVAVGRNLVDHFTLRTTGALKDYYHLNTPYSQYGIAVSVLVVPLYALSKVVGHQDLLISLLNPVLVASTAVAVYYIGRALHWRKSAAVLAAVGFGVCTMALQSTTEVLSEPGVALCEALMVLAVVRWRSGWRWAPLLLGVASAVVVQFREDSAFTVWLGLLAVPLFVPWQAIIRRRNVVLFALPVVMTLGFFIWYNYLRWGKLFVSSYNGQGFHTPLGLGLEGLVLSPGKSFFVFNPVAILGAVGLVLLLWRDRPLAVLCLVLTIPRLFFFAKWDAWEGGVTWGPRFLMPVVFLFVLAAVEVLNATTRRSFSWAAARASFVVLVLVSVPVGFLSVRVPYEQWWQTVENPQLRAQFEGGGSLLRHPAARTSLRDPVMDSLDFTVKASPLRGNLLLIEKGKAEMAPKIWRTKDSAVGWLLLCFSGCWLSGAAVFALREGSADRGEPDDAADFNRRATNVTDPTPLFVKALEGETSAVGGVSS